ncbi:DUF5753 domain-containing protein [Saccharothrix obliqua]|uniref:DUF5753 domain-containing protein n=1 Tax=Saccharothrix obliqua TaxID=2861747 RepID=UPI001C5F665D|nr:DUF5753 domain-containing protein [Saccharothrix obliqua]MBW4716343.1 DUF5753 domain-containing protein [Saccharothrix obliqua]
MNWVTHCAAITTKAGTETAGVSMARLAAGRSLDNAAALIRKDRSRLIKVGDGRSTLKADLEQLLTFYGAGVRERRKVLAMGVEARQRQPKRAYVDLLPGAGTRIADLEAAATRISYYERGVVPGLLQIPEYTEATMAACDGIWWPDRSYEERTRRVAFRMERQKVLADKELMFFITEDALVWAGDRDTMRRQVQHLVDATRQPNITLRLLDSNDSRNPCPQGAMILLHFAEGTRPVSLLPVAYGPSTYLDEPSDIAAVERCFQRLSEIAFSPEESQSRLLSTLEAM